MPILLNFKRRDENQISNVDKNDFKIMKNCKLKQTAKVLSREMAIKIYLRQIIQWLLISILINTFLLNNNRIFSTVDASILANIPISSVSGTSVSLLSSSSVSPGSTHYSGKFDFLKILTFYSFMLNSESYLFGLVIFH